MHGLVVLWVKLWKSGYTRSVTSLYRVMQRLGIYEKAPSKKKKYEPAEELEQSDKSLTYEERMMADIKRRIAEKVDEETPDYDFDE